MKNIIFVLMLVVIASSCGVKSDGYIEGIPSNCNMCLSTVEFDSCEYVYLRRYGSVSICHKGNCPNPIHKTTQP